MTPLKRTPKMPTDFPFTYDLTQELSATLPLQCLEMLFGNSPQYEFFE